MNSTVKNARTSITGIKTECFVNGVNLSLMDMIRLNGNSMTKIQNLIHADASFRRSVRVRNNYEYFDSERIRTNERRAEMERELDNDKLAWKSIKDDGLPPVGSCLIVTIKNHGYGGRRELRYPVHYLEKSYAPGYAFYMNGTDILLPEYSEVVAWMHVPTPYEGK